MPASSTWRGTSISPLLTAGASREAGDLLVGEVPVERHGVSFQLGGLYVPVAHRNRQAVTVPEIGDDRFDRDAAVGHGFLAGAVRLLRRPLAWLCKARTIQLSSKTEIRTTLRECRCCTRCSGRRG